MPSPHEVYDQAIELKNQGDLPAAVEKLKEVLVIDPNHSDTHSALAVYLQRIGDFPQALEHARKVCELNPDDVFSFTQLSVICVKCGLIQEAEDARDRARALQSAG